MRQMIKKIALILIPILFTLPCVFGQDVPNYIIVWNPEIFNKIEVNNKTGYDMHVLVRPLAGTPYLNVNVPKGLTPYNVTGKDGVGNFNEVRDVELTSKDINFECIRGNCTTILASEESKVANYKVLKLKPNTSLIDRLNKEEKIKVTVKKDDKRHVLSIEIEND